MFYHDVIMFFLSGSFVSRPSRETAPAPAKFLESFVD